jgi:Cof subfamily protein (haloacid dehalogenase superfamily)
MPRPRLLALDVDGTLLTGDHRITPAVAAAVHRARALGVEVVLATSRPPRALWPILASLDLVSPAVFVASQGALTGSYALGGLLQVLDRRPMPIDQALAAVASAQALGLSVNWLAGEDWLVPDVDVRIREEARIVGCTPDVADLSAQVTGPDKILVLSGPDRADLPDALALPDGLVAEVSTSTHVEITASGVDKGVALARLCDRMGIPPDGVLAMGDGRNDLSMLELAGVAGAPANAHPDVRAAADHIAPSNDDDAVAWVIDTLL